MDDSPLMPLFNYFLDAGVLLLVVGLFRQLNSWRKHRSLRLPPGPKPLPLIGNVLDMQDPELWETARIWGQKYGPLIHVNSFGSPYMFVNSYQMCIDLFEKQGGHFSSRPKNMMFELEGWDWLIPMMPYGEPLRKARQLLHRFLQPSVMVNYHDLQTHATHKMLEKLLETPDKFPEILRHATGETIIKIAYGHQVEEKNDPYIELAEKGLAAAIQAEEFFLVNAFPALQYLPSWFPGATFKKITEEGYKYSMALLHEPYRMAKKEIAQGIAAPSIISKLHDAILAGDPTISDESMVPKVAGVTYGAGADTTVAALYSFFLAMLLHPEAQRQAQEEIDRVVGKDTLPSFSDRPNLPYVNAIIKEVLRWQSIAPLSIAHTALEDSEYNGYFIPAGTTMLPNLWAISRDPELYPNPEKFIPERWLPQKGKELPLDVHKAQFGVGRRICPGRHFADNSMFIGAASILAAFNIKKAVDFYGREITPPAEYEPHFVRHPKPFKYRLIPRSEKIALIIRQAVDVHS